jgi:hypothetical protein
VATPLGGSDHGSQTYFRNERRTCQRRRAPFRVGGLRRPDLDVAAAAGADRQPGCAGQGDEGHQRDIAVAGPGVGSRVDAQVDVRFGVDELDAAGIGDQSKLTAL